MRGAACVARPPQRLLLGLAPRPTGAGVGVWQALSSPGNTPRTLPAGGTWAYFFVQRMIANNSVGNVGVGVSAGGTRRCSRGR